jgi:predicted metal-dependent enzyme (double-stranded beta helix superfamily)
MSLTIEELELFVQSLAADSDRWVPLVRRDGDQRAYELIWEDEDVNAWLICWSEDHDTGFHDHDVSAAAITVIDGHVREDRLRLDGPPVSRVNGPGSLITLAPNAIHRVLHAGTGTAVTIHAYSPPLTRTGAYSIGADGALLRHSQSFEEELRAEQALIAAAGA